MHPKIKRMIKHVPNIMTFGRLVLTVGFLAMILHSPNVEKSRALFFDVAFVLFVITGVTDLLDGFVARRYNVTSKLGRIMDPLADKFLVCGAFCCFAVVGVPSLFDGQIASQYQSVILWAVFIVLMAREVYVTLLRHVAEAKGISFAATASGKIKMFLQSFTIGTVLIKTGHVTRIWGDWFTAITLALMVAATIISGIRATQRKI